MTDLPAPAQHRPAVTMLQKLGSPGWLPIPQFLGVYLIFILVLTNLFLILDDIPLVLEICIIGILLASALGRADIPLRGNPDTTLSIPSFSKLMIGLGLCLPAIAYLGLTFDQELATAGDFGFHVGSYFSANGFWNYRGGWLFLQVVAIVAPILVLWRFGLTSIAIVLALCVLVYWSTVGDYGFSRYPSLGYILRFPLVGIDHSLLNDTVRLSASFGLLDRVSNLLAPLSWLFLLRPVLFGAWPDWRVVPVAGFLLFQPMFVYYTTSTYLEAWGVIFSLLSIESIVRHGDRGAVLACLLIGAAAMVKEPFILALPFVWMSGRPWIGPWTRRVTLFTAGLVSGLPFVVYYLFRLPSDSHRAVYLTPERLWSEEVLGQFVYRLIQDFEPSGFILLVAVILLTCVMIGLARSRRWHMACLLGSGIIINALFLGDSINGGDGTVGYYRFFMIPLPFLCAGLWAIGYPAADSRTVRVVLAVATVGVVAGHSMPMGKALIDTTRPDAVRNFIEHFTTPVFFPIEELVGRAHEEGLLEGIDSVRMNMADYTQGLRPWQRRSYPGEVRFSDECERLQSLDPEGAGYLEQCGLQCACSDPKRGIMALFVHMVAYNAPDDGRKEPWLLSDKYAVGTPPSDIRRFEVWRALNARRKSCVAALRASCREVLVSEVDGKIWGALGVP